ncbi:MAG TPA: asparagine synthase-related protein [Terriglobales bacterium]|nr:asparagine synthase-related protein [Terriglobales bacterium]
MPGIVGLITKARHQDAERQLLAMLAPLHHESFYVVGTWSDPSLGVYVGWVAREGSFSDGMPLTNEHGTSTLIFSGEDHSEPHKIASLKQQGHRIESGGGPGYLVHLYEEDPTFPAGLNGWFHGLIANRMSGEVMLFNDRFGMHRLYYHESKDSFYFAAEAKAILAVRPELRTINSQALGEWIECGCVLENRTLFRNLQILPPGSAWKFRNSSLESRDNYFNPSEWEQQTTLPAKDFQAEFREAFSRNLPRHFDGRELVGMSLTGGLDTRMIMAWHRASPGSFPCYTFGGTYRECRDVVVAQQVARACGQPHTVIRCGPEFISRFPDYAERSIYLTDGCADVSCSPVLYGSQQAREIAPVRMTGNYGDQVLRGLRAFKAVAPAHGLFASDLDPYLAAAHQTYSRVADTHPLTFAAFRQAPWHHHSLLALEQTQLTMRSPFLDNEVVRTLFRAPESVTANNDLRIRMIGDGNTALRNIRTDMGFAGRRELFPGSIIRKYQAFTFKIDYAYNHGMPQWMAKIDHAFAPLHLERLFLGRHKYYHFRVWYKDFFAKYLREMLLDSRTLCRPYWQKNNLQAMVEHHIKGDRNYTNEIHRVLSLELLHRVLLDGSPSGRNTFLAKPFDYSSALVGR